MTDDNQNRRGNVIAALLIAGAVLALLICGITSCAAILTGDNDAAAPTAPPATETTAAPTTGKPPAAAVSVGEGTYEVGVDVKPGTYRTTVPSDAVNCYWARLRDLDGTMHSIVANDNIAPNGKGLVKVNAKDAAIEFSGPCEWTRTA